MANFQFNLKGTAIQVAKQLLFLVPPKEEEEVSSVSYLNTPVYDDMYLGDLEFPENNKYFDLDGNEIVYDSIYIQNLLVNVSNQKEIVRTKISGKDTTVKEYISKGDFIINCVANFSKKQNLYPESDIVLFDQIYNVPDSIKVTSRFLNRLGITRVVLDNLNMGQQEGKFNEQIITFTMSSDIEIELENVSS